MPPLLNFDLNNQNKVNDQEQMAWKAEVQEHMFLVDKSMFFGILFS